MFILREAFRGLSKNKLMALVTFGVMFFSLFIFGLFLISTVNLFLLIQKAEEKVGISAFLEDELSDNEIESLKRDISSLMGVQEVIFVSKSEAFEKFREDLGEDSDLLEALETNPLPASFDIKLYESFKDPKNLESISRKVDAMPGVEEIKYGEEWVKILDRVVKVLVGIDLILGVIISFSSIFVVANTIKLTVFARRKQIEIMELVGATHRFIISPFLVEGVIEGILAGGFASGLLFGIYNIFAARLGDFIQVTRELFIIVVVFGTLLGYIGSHISVKKFLRAPIGTELPKGK
ncbi:ABC transporter permease [candidate division WOR-3 bacterium]|nr:ABC transporter permease [candidate division WOR-3 bacterium]MCK4576474.1 ABC transporter permease [candidate division WOR-3 bacterium]